MNNEQNGESIRPRKLSWGVVGSSGFVGAGIEETLQQASVKEIRKITAPRLRTLPVYDASSIYEEYCSDSHATDAVRFLAESFSGLDVVVNAAGMASPDSKASDELFGANALLPLVIAEAAKQARVQKVLHISSAAVQGPKDILDETPFVDPFSAYSHSKACGEQLLGLWNSQQALRHQASAMPETIVIRATSVQGAGRGTSQALQRVARSRLSSIAAPGRQPSVVSSLEGLSRFVVKIGCYDGTVPSILLQPWEGASVKQILELAGDGRAPLVLPTWLAKAGVRTLRTLGNIHPRMTGISRRLEVMWFGQDQVSGWAVDNGLIGLRHDGPSEMLRKVLVDEH